MKVSGIMLLEKEAEKHGVKRIAEKMGYTYSYIHQILTGKMPITDRVRYRMHRLEGMKPIPKTVTTRWRGSEADRQLVLKLTNDERQAALKEAAERKRDGR